MWFDWSFIMFRDQIITTSSKGNSLPQNALGFYIAECHRNNNKKQILRTAEVDCFQVTSIRYEFWVLLLFWKCSCVRMCRMLTLGVLCSNRCVFQEGWVGPTGCQVTNFECRSCYTFIRVSSLGVCPSVSHPGASFLSASIRYPSGDLPAVFLLTTLTPQFPAAGCGCQDAAAGTELPLPHTSASRSDALCVFTVRYGFILASLTLFFL